MSEKLLYALARPMLFAMDAESAHNLTLPALRRAASLGLTGVIRKPDPDPRTVMGITFPNPVGLAAGLDKDGAYIDGLAALGFGFIEVGTVTPRAQAGNPKPRMFRIPARQAIINRMGFNNGGVDAFVTNVQASRFYQNKEGVLGLNIGKNADTPIERAADDYLTCLEKVYPYASYVTVNISSPNTKNLRQLQDASELDTLLARLKDAFPTQFAGIKDSSHNADFARAVGARFGSDLLALTGTDSYMQLAMENHAAGCITAPANVISPDLRNVWDLIIDGKDAAEAQERVTRKRRLLEKYPPFPPTLKALMHRMYDLPRWAVKPPLMAIPAEDEEKALQELQEIS